MSLCENRMNLFAKGLPKKKKFGMDSLAGSNSMSDEFCQSIVATAVVTSPKIVLFLASSCVTVDGSGFRG